MALNGATCVVGTARIVPAIIANQRTYQALINTNDKQYRNARYPGKCGFTKWIICHADLPTLLRKLQRSLFHVEDQDEAWCSKHNLSSNELTREVITTFSNSLIPGLARITRSPARNSLRCNLKASRHSRFMRLRFIASPTFFLETTNPNRETGWSAWLISSSKYRVEILLVGLLKTRLKSLAPSIRCVFVKRKFTGASPSRHLCYHSKSDTDFQFWSWQMPVLLPTQAVRRIRPLARRRLRTCLPFLVAMRARNPWVRLRFRILGWKVRFMMALANFAYYSGNLDQRYPMFSGVKKEREFYRHNLVHAIEKLSAFISSRAICKSTDASLSSILFKTPADWESSLPLTTYPQLANRTCSKNFLFFAPGFIR